ncbi:hypothetical protein G6F42_024572 [Rhizopus arrhizus]|nr:hypothetical protein G6F42_024572 [Rhizopus arrhizus]
MVTVAQQTVANKLVETQIKLSSWYTETSQQIAWLLEESKTSSDHTTTIKQDTLAIVDAAQVEINTRIEETKLVVRAYYAHLTYLSWAERRRIEYALDSIKASLTASITQFKKSIEKAQVTKEEIVRYASYSFGATASRIVITDLQSIVVKVTNVKETTTVVNKSEEIQAEKTKIAIVGGTKTDKVTEVGKTTTTTTAAAAVVDKVDSSVTKTNASKVDHTSKVHVDQQQQGNKLESEVEQTKVSKVDNKQSSGSSTSATVVDQHQVSGHATTATATTAAVSTAVIGAAAAAIAGAAIVHHHEAKTESKQEQSKTDVAVIQTPTKYCLV